MKKALLVGINRFAIPNDDLRGCVNDVLNMHSVLVNLYGFKPENIRVVTDARATKQNIIDRMNWLMSTSQPGDELVMQFSSHGSQMRDRDGDELREGMDEVLITHDHSWERPFTDDHIKEIVLKCHPEANLSMICDTCHSGTMTDGVPIKLPGKKGLTPTKLVRKKAMKKRKKKDRIIASERFLEPPVDIKARSMSLELETRRFGKKPIKAGSSPQNHTLISGCRDDQTSADAYIANKFQGAMTFALTYAIKANPNGTWREIHQKVLQILKGKFTQIPQLSGSDPLLDRPVFGGR